MLFTTSVETKLIELKKVINFLFLLVYISIMKATEFTSITKQPKSQNQLPFFSLSDVPTSAHHPHHHRPYPIGDAAPVFLATNHAASVVVDGPIELYVTLGRCLLFICPQDRRKEICYTWSIGLLFLLYGATVLLLSELIKRNVGPLLGVCFCPLSVDDDARRPAVIQFPFVEWPRPTGQTGRPFNLIGEID